MIARAVAIAALLLVLLAPALRGHAEAQRAPIAATASVEVQSALLGERFRLAVMVTHPADLLVSVEPPARSATLQLIEVVPAARTPGTPGAATTTTRFEYVLAAFALGDVTLPAQRVSWLDAQGETGSLQVAAPPLPVRARSADDDTTLRPLKPQAEVGGAPLWWQRSGPYALGVAAACAVIAYGTYRWRTRPRRAVAVAPAIAPVDEAARARLDVLAAGNPLARGDYDGYYGTIAEVVRDHLETHFGFNARALTTAELQQRMVALGVERWQARLVSGLLDRCDGAVYARRRPDPSSADHDLTMAYEIVELSREHETVHEDGGGGMTFALPLLLVMIPLVAGALVWRFRVRPAARPALRAADLGILAAAGQRPSWRMHARHLPTALRVIALLLLIIAAARPQRGLALTFVPEQGIDLVVALDVSGSMSQSLGRGQPTRLEAAKAVVRDFVATLDGDRVGLVIFQARSLVLAPLTVDRIAVRRAVEGTESGLLPDGTAIGLAAAEGLNLLRTSPARSRVLVLLTDGENNAGEIQPLQSAALAKTLGVRLYTIAFTGRGESIDRGVLRRMAEDTGGASYDATSQEELRRAYDQIGALERSRLGERKFTRYQELAPWIAGAAVTLLVIEAALRATVLRRHP